MRVSKAPEERKQEMIDTAMRLFAKKGYEAVTMKDIAREMNVVSGLCYRYFKSKEELYHSALELYARECAAPIILIFSMDFNSLEEYMIKIAESFRKTDGKEKYHEFFHGEGNQMFHRELEYAMLELLSPYVIQLFERLQEKNQIEVEDCRTTALFVLYGQMPIINDDHLPTEQKIQLVINLLRRFVPSK